MYHLGKTATRLRAARLVSLLIAFSAIGCVGSNTKLQVNVTPDVSSAPPTRAALADVFVDDTRVPAERSSAREAAFGVSMGAIAFEPNELAIVEQTLESELARLLEQGDYESSQFFECELLAFDVRTKPTTLYWDVVGRVALRLKLRHGSLELSGTHTERTYIWPGEEIIEEVVRQSLAQVVAQLRAAARDLRSEQLAGFSERPVEWLEREAKRSRAAELGLPVGMTLPEGRALLYFVRPSGGMGGGSNVYKISVEGKRVTNLKNRGRFAYVVPPGTVEIAAATVPNLLNIGLALLLMGRPKMILELEPGGTYFIEVKVDLAGGPKLVPVDEERGLELIRATTWMEAVQE